MDVAALRSEFPLLQREPRLTWLDSASTTPKPRRVLEAIRRYHEEFTSNVHRGVHALAAEATAAYESARHAAASHVGGSPGELVFTRGTTEALNLVASSLGLRPDDEIITTVVEHHSNMLPWRRAKVVELPSTPEGTPRWDALERALSPRTRLVAVHHASNVLGTVAPIEAIASILRGRDVALLVDGAQAAGHLPVDVAALGCDFYAFSAHKLGGPTGIGALWARASWLERLEPFHLGGGMVAKVADAGLEMRMGPHRFEAGTPNVEGSLGMAAALELLRDVGMERVRDHGRELARELVDGCASLPGVRLLGPRDAERVPLVALDLGKEIDAESVARTLADGSGFLVSAGRHCAHRLHDRLGAGSTLRASAWIVNDLADVARFVESLRDLLE